MTRYGGGGGGGGEGGGGGGGGVAEGEEKNGITSFLFPTPLPLHTPPPSVCYFLLRWCPSEGLEIIGVFC